MDKLNLNSVLIAITFIGGLIALICACTDGMNFYPIWVKIYLIATAISCLIAVPFQVWFLKNIK